MASDKLLKNFKRIEDGGRQLPGVINDVEKDLTNLSNCLRYLHAESTLSTESESYKDILVLRNDMRKYGMVYVKFVHPFFDNILRYLRRITNSYTQSDFKEWKDNIGQLLKLVNECDELCEVTLKLFGLITPILKRSEDDSRNLRGYINMKTEKLRKAENWADTKSVVTFFGTVTAAIGAIVLAPAAVAIIPVTAGAVAVFRQKQTAFDCKAQRESTNANNSLLCENMITPMKSLNNSLEVVVSFIKTLKETLGDIDQSESVANQKYYEGMKKIVIPVGKSCNKTIASVPNVLANLKCIPSNDLFEWIEEVGASMEFTEEKKVTTERGEKLKEYLKLSEAHQNKSSLKFREKIDDLKKQLSK